MRVLVAGAGLSGAVAGRALAENGHDITIVDERAHVAGNCHTARDPATGVMVHVYGPHVFHTDNARVWDYVRRFAEMMPYVNRVKAVVRGEVYQLPINLHSLNQFFRTAFCPAEARAHVAALVRDDIETPGNFEEQALRRVGEDLYHAFLEGYTRKQWGVDPACLPASILNRLPVRFSYDDNYYTHRHQGIPREGYSAMVDAILDHPRIALRLNSRAEDTTGAFDHVLWTGPLDRYFDHAEGRLAYRTLRFETIRSEGDIQGTAVMNYCDAEVAHTRISEHKYFAPWERAGFSHSIAYREFSTACGPDDIPFYPLRLAGDKALLARYVARAKASRGVTFLGRLGTYAYLDMDVTIARALQTAEALLLAWGRGHRAPAFVHDPMN